MLPSLDADGLDLVFQKARTHFKWTDKPVHDQLLRRVWLDARMGPTSANCQPLRVIFVRSQEAKEKLRPALSKGNTDKTMAAPVTAIFAYDLKFYDDLPRMFPHADARSWFAGNAALAEETAMRNATLQAAYFMLAARAHGLDCGPMSGFDRAKVDAAFFPEGSVRSNFLCNLGYGDPSALFERGPRFEFDEVCRVE